MRAFLICVSLLITALLVPVTGNTNNTPSPPQAECPLITMETPSAIICPDAEVTFTAGVLGGDSNYQQTYHWTVSAGRIISGQGTPTITVATVNASADIEMGLKATVEVAGGQWGSCSRTASHGVQVKAFCPDRRFDQFLGTASLEEEKARLGNFASRLRGEPHTIGIITLRSGGKMVVGEAAERLERARKYLVDVLGIEMDRVYTREGDSLEELTIELWVMPTNPNAPSRNNSMPSH
ncbi:MAG TPA: hypothetical protein VNI02_19935 [Blastocatellia bacterium]|nr:hypothetical protein [Blastocatellia bacterium]